MFRFSFGVRSQRSFADIVNDLPLHHLTDTSNLANQRLNVANQRLNLANQRLRRHTSLDKLGRGLSKYKYSCNKNIKARVGVVLQNYDQVSWFCAVRSVSFCAAPLKHSAAFCYANKRPDGPLETGLKSFPNPRPSPQPANHRSCQPDENRKKTAQVDVCIYGSVP